MAGINLAKANQIFSSMKGAAKWTPKTLPNGTKVSYVNKGNGVIEKIVERTNGTTIKSTFDNGGLVGVMEKNAKGSIEHYFGAANYDKMIKVSTDRDDDLTRLGHKAKKGFVDYNYNYNGLHRTVGGDFTKEIKNALAYIRNNDANNTYQPKNMKQKYINILKQQWAQPQQPTPQEKDPFLAFCARWAK